MDALGAADLPLVSPSGDGWPWTSPDPELPTPFGGMNRAQKIVRYDLYTSWGRQTDQHQFEKDGIYYDSIGSAWAGNHLQNFRRDQMPYVDFPLTFDHRTGKVSITHGFSAIEFLRYWTDNWVAVFEASTGYNHPLFENSVPKPMPILSNDPTSHPADKLQVLETVNEWHATYGYPGPAGPASDEVADNFILVDMMAKAATDKATPEEAVAWAQKEIELIYKKWSAV